MAGKNFDKYSAIFSPEKLKFSLHISEHIQVIQGVWCDVIQGETVWGDNGWEEVNLSEGEK